MPFGVLTALGSLVFDTPTFLYAQVSGVFLLAGLVGILITFTKGPPGPISSVVAMQSVVVAVWGALVQNQTLNGL